jgi:hypothetical protein
MVGLSKMPDKTEKEWASWLREKMHHIREKYAKVFSSIFLMYGVVKKMSEMPFDCPKNASLNINYESLLKDVESGIIRLSKFESDLILKMVTIDRKIICLRLKRVNWSRIKEEKAKGIRDTIKFRFLPLFKAMGKIQKMLSKKQS